MQRRRNCISSFLNKSIFWYHVHALLCYFIWLFWYMRDLHTAQMLGIPVCDINFLDPAFSFGFLLFGRSIENEGRHTPIRQSPRFIMCTGLGHSQFWTEINKIIKLNANEWPFYSCIDVNVYPKRPIFTSLMVFVVILIHKTRLRPKLSYMKFESAF